MLFGVRQVSGAPDATYPWVMLAWDMNRRVWQPNWRLAGGATRFFAARAVATTTALGPTAPPTAPATTLVTKEGWAAGWTNGDASAETEYWEKEDTGAWTLTYVAPPGATNTGALLGRKSHLNYTWKVRHRKNGVPSQYTADQAVQTLMVGLVVSNAGFTAPSTFHLTFRNDNEGVVAGIVSVAGVDGAPVPGLVKGSTFTRSYQAGTGTIKGKCDDVFWSVTPSAYGTSVNV